MHLHAPAASPASPFHRGDLSSELSELRELRQFLFDSTHRILHRKTGWRWPVSLCTPSKARRLLQPGALIGQAIKHSHLFNDSPALYSFLSAILPDLRLSSRPWHRCMPRNESRLDMSVGLGLASQKPEKTCKSQNGTHSNGGSFCNESSTSRMPDLMLRFNERLKMEDDGLRAVGPARAPAAFNPFYRRDVSRSYPNCS